MTCSHGRCGLLVSLVSPIVAIECFSVSQYDRSFPTMYRTAFYPADTVKSMVQTNPDHMGKGFLETFFHVFRHEGIFGLYRGWGITAARAAPAHALIFAVYEYTMKLLRSEPRDGSHPRPKKDAYAMHESIRD